MLNIIRKMVLKDIKKRRATYPSHDEFKESLDVPYLDDGKRAHQIDFYYAKENKKNVCVIDIHGGAYMFGDRYDNFPFAYELLKAGFDVITLDYEVINKSRNLSDIVLDTVKAINFIADYLDEYGLTNRDFVIAGDSAGGHLALLISELLLSKDLQVKLNLELRDIPFKGIVVNSPVYDLTKAASYLSNSGVKRMFGKDTLKEGMLTSLSPREYIKVIDKPIFLSTCKNDFIREQTLLMKDDLSKYSLLTYVDIDVENKNVDHVHNVCKPHLKESIEVNNKIIEFIDKLKLQLNKP